MSLSKLSTIGPHGVHDLPAEEVGLALGLVTTTDDGGHTHPGVSGLHVVDLSQVLMSRADPNGSSAATSSQ